MKMTVTMFVAIFYSVKDASEIMALQRFVKKSIGDFGQSTSPGLIAI